jgi:17beta-estradiol 17-dehydrogenase / very-long-chain 3-oxoacyl-CoA reductase
MGLATTIVALAGKPVGATAISLLVVVGALQGIKSLLRFINGVYIYFIRPGKDLKKLGEWAVVTGATDGIGLAYAKHLAKLGDSPCSALHQDFPILFNIKNLPYS